MKTFIYIIGFWVFGIVAAHAEIPKAELQVISITSGQWPAEYRLSLMVPKDHHAYLDKGDENIYLPVEFDAEQKLTASHLKIVDLQRPLGVYDNKVEATVLRGQGDFYLTIAPLDSQPVIAKDVVLTVRYQLCNDITHVCFRPQSTEASLMLPSASIDHQSLTDRLLALFTINRNQPVLIFGLMMLAGLLSVATPCVYPMLPITSMFIVNRAQGVVAKEKIHALIYVIGIVGSYAMLGIIAGMTGGAFNSFMQSAWVNIGFAIFFAFFAISLFGFYELSFMQNEVQNLDQYSARVKGLTGTWLMGTVAGIVISPCVGPIVFALLLQVADQIADKADALKAMGLSLTFWDKLAVASQGGIMMSGFGLGAGLPFFLFSVIKFKKLPKSGYWMNKIKYAFGFLILYFAYSYFAKGMGVLGVDSTVTLSMALGILALWFAVVHCNVLSLLPVDAQPNQKMHHFFGVMALVIGIWLIVADLGQIPLIKTARADNVTSVNSQSDANRTIQEEAGISWYRNFDAAQQVAQQMGKPIFIDFYADWCANCIAFKAKAANNQSLNRALKMNAVAVKLVDKEVEFEKFRRQPEHRQLKIGLPYFAILSPDGKLLWSSTDYLATEQMVAVLTRS